MPAPFGFGRADRSFLARWFWTVDRTLLFLLIVLMGLGIIAVAAASPAAALRLSDASTRIPPLFFLYRQLIWLGIGLVVLLSVSMLPRDLARRLAILGAGGAFAALALVPLIGAEVNGAVRWIQLPGFQLQPSEILKPLFVVTTAWLFAARFEDRSLPVIPIGRASCRERV